jgi:putative endonuclease
VNPERHFWVYILSSKSRRIYTGVTNDIGRRIREHKSGEFEGFTQRYRINRLVYYERFRYIGNAINREKQIKSLDRAKRVALIEDMNPTWDDLSEEWGKPVGKIKVFAAGKESRSLATLVMTTEEKPS